MQLDAILGKIATCDGVANLDVATHDYAQVIQILDFEIYEAQDLDGLTTDRYYKTLHMKEACEAFFHGPIFSKNPKTAPVSD